MSGKRSPSVKREPDSLSGSPKTPKQGARLRRTQGGARRRLQMGETVARPKRRGSGRPPDDRAQSRVLYEIKPEPTNFPKTTKFNYFQYLTLSRAAIKRIAYANDIPKMQKGVYHLSMDILFTLVYTILFDANLLRQSASRPLKRVSLDHVQDTIKNKIKLTKLYGEVEDHGRDDSKIDALKRKVQEAQEGVKQEKLTEAKIKLYHACLEYGHFSDLFALNAFRGIGVGAIALLVQKQECLNQTIPRSDTFWKYMRYIAIHCLSQLFVMAYTYTRSAGRVTLLARDVAAVMLATKGKPCFPTVATEGANSLTSEVAYKITDLPFMQEKGAEWLKEHERGKAHETLAIIHGRTGDRRAGKKEREEQALQARRREHGRLLGNKDGSDESDEEAGAAIEAD